jgi:hypothetical protein
VLRTTFAYGEHPIHPERYAKEKHTFCDEAVVGNATQKM